MMHFSVGQFVGWPVGQLVGQPIGWLASWLDGQLVGWPVGWLAGQLVGRLVGWLVGQLIGWPVGWPVGGQPVGWLASWLFVKIVKSQCTTEIQNYRSNITKKGRKRMTFHFLGPALETSDPKFHIWAVHFYISIRISTLLTKHTTFIALYGWLVGCLFVYSLVGS